MCMYVYIYMCVCIYIYIYMCEAIPVQSWTGPEGFRRLKFSEFLDNRHINVARSAIVPTAFTPEKALTSVVGCVDPTAVVRRKVLINANFQRPHRDSNRLIAQCFSQLHYMYVSKYVYMYFLVSKYGKTPCLQFQGTLWFRRIFSCSLKLLISLIMSAQVSHLRSIWRTVTTLRTSQNAGELWNARAKHCGQQRSCQCASNWPATTPIHWLNSFLLSADTFSSARTFKCPCFSQI